MYQNQINPSALFRTYRANRALTNTCIGTAVGVFTTWSYARRGIIYDVTDDTTKRLKTMGMFPQSINLPNPTRLYNRMADIFLLDSSRPNNYVSWIGSAFSHTNFSHILFNMLTWSNFAPMLFFLPTRHYAALIFGGAMASSAAWLYDCRGKQGRALGASGIVSGLMTCVTCFMPFARASFFGVLPLPLWAITGSYFLVDAYFMQSGSQTGIGHAAHIGGGMFGALYYAVFLRKYGGLLSRGVSNYV